MRVLMLTPYLWAPRGNSTTVRRISCALQRQGLEVQVVTMEEADWPRAVQAALAERPPALVHGFHAGHMGTALEVVPELGQYPWVVTATGTDLSLQLGGEGSARVRRALEVARAVVVFSREHLRLLAEGVPRLATPVTVIPQGVELEPGPPLRREDAGLQPGQVVWVWAGGLRPVKRLELALEGMAPVARTRPGLRLLVLGGVLDAEYAARLIRRMEQLPWVVYAGEIPHCEVASWLGLADAVLNTSASEGQPQAALEAMSLGKPAVMTAVVGNLGVMEPGREGFYVHDAQELAAAVERLSADPVLRRQMGERARRLVAGRFSVAAETAGYLRVYREVAGG